MALTKDNIETVVRLLVALAQRHQTIFDLAQRLNTGVVWRSTEGKVELPFTEDERKQFEQFITEYLRESEVIAATLRSYLGGKPT